jgi:hypothetical protein
MTLYIHLKPALAVAAGVVALTSPKLERFAVATYLIVIGVLGFMGK